MKDLLSGVGIDQKLIASLFLIYAVYILGRLFNLHEGYLWDFRVCYSAAKTYLQGLNPYNVDVLLSVQQNVARLPYMYPPLVIYYFLPFTLFEASEAVVLYLLIKIAALFVLFLVWNRIFSFERHLGLFLFFALLAFNSALYKDLETGNISGIEQLGLWLAFYFFLNGKNWYFAILLVLTSTIKLLPIVFLGMLFFSDAENKYKVLVSSVSVFLLYLGLNIILEPELSSRYIDSMISTSPTSIASNDMNQGGIGNASSYELVKYAVSQWTPAIAVKVSMGVYLMLCAGCIICTWVYLKPLFHQKNNDTRLLVLFTGILLGILILPRFKDYSYVLAVLPAYYLIIRIKERKNLVVWLIVICLSSINLSAPIFRQLQELYWNFYTLILTGVLWGLYLCEACRAQLRR